MDFTSDISLDEVLITLELHRAISAYALVVVALDCIIEGIHTEIQYAVIRISILMDNLVHKTRLIVCSKVLRCHEMALVEVSLAHWKQVNGNKEYDRNARNGHAALSYKRTFLAHGIHFCRPHGPEKESSCKCYHPERCPCIFGHQSCSVKPECIYKDVRLSSIHSTSECTCNTWHQCADKAEKSGTCICNNAGLA